MKITLRALAALGALLTLLTACAPKELTFTGETPEGVFRADEILQAALEESHTRDINPSAHDIDGVSAVVDERGTSAQITVRPADDALTETVYTVDLDTRQATVTSARYRKANGDWYTYAVADGAASEKPFWLKLSDPSPANVGGDKALPAELAANDKVTLSLTLGEGHTFYFTEGENGTVSYLEVPLTVRFADKEARDAFRRKHPGGDASDGEEGQYLWTARALLQLTGATSGNTGRQDEIDLLLQDFGNPVVFTVTLGEDGAIRTFTSQA